jgi:hypothetical protein
VAGINAFHSSAGPAIRAIKTSGRDRVRAAIQHAVEPFRQMSGGCLLENRFRYLLAARA